MAPWWREAVVYQVYPRSFQDTDGDGVGDLRGIERRLDHVSSLGADALWLSPIYPSPGADLGYDISDHAAIDPAFGTIEDFDRLLATTHGRGLKLLLDLVPSHTSIEHPWFREHPDWYVWADGPRPPNNWIAAFGGPAWTRDERSGRWYLHSFYPEQPDLDWRNPEVRAAIADVIRFWLDRGADGFRVDAVDRLMKDPEMRDEPPATAPFGLPLPPEVAAWDYVHSGNHADIGIALEALREAAGDAFLVGEVYLPHRDLRPYAEAFDLVFAFEFLHAPPEPEALAAAIGGAAELDSVAWVLSNHDFPRVATRWGERLAPVAAALLLFLPGAAFVYQGEELGLRDGPEGRRRLDRYGRDGARSPMPWDGGPGRGFTSGEPWLPLPAGPGVAAQSADPASTLSLFRRLIALRRDLRGPVAVREAAEGLLVLERGNALLAANFGGEPAALPGPGDEVLLETREGALGEGGLAPASAAVLSA